MAEASEPVQKRLESLVDRLEDDLVDEDGASPDRQHITDIVSDVASKFEEAPVQDFVPLLVEHDARDVLADEGLHRVLPSDEEAPLHDTGDAEETHAPRILPRT
jgi:hypothetical protein